MKKVRRFSNDLAVVNKGWRIHDQQLLRELDPARGPRTQIFSYSEPEDEEPTQETTKWCPNCNQYTLEYVDALDAYFCTRCTTKKYAKEIL